MGTQINLDAVSVSAWPNPLLTRRFRPLPFPPKHKPKEKRTTVIIGIRCADGIVFASDSLVSGGTMNRADYQKLYAVPLGLNGSDGMAVVGGSGPPAFTEEAIEILRGKVTQGVKSPREFVDQLQNAYAEVWNKHMRRHRRILGLPSNKTIDLAEIAHDQETEAIFLDFALLAGAKLKCDQAFHLYATERGIAGNAQHYTAIGSGAVVALYILHKTWPFGTTGPSDGRRIVTLKKARKLALTTIDEIVEARIEGCGGETQVLAITKDASVMQMNNDEKAEIRQENKILRFVKFFGVTDKPPEDA